MRKTPLTCNKKMVPRGASDGCGLRAPGIERLATHWRRVLPLQMLTIDYETLVADLEGESRRLIEFLDLDWEPGCLKFLSDGTAGADLKRMASTSAAFTSSVGRWRK